VGTSYFLAMNAKYEKARYRFEDTRFFVSSDLNI
jgi:hypothetical protein